MLTYCVGKDLAATGKITDGESNVMFIAVHSTATVGSVVIKNGIDAGGVISFKANILANV